MNKGSIVERLCSDLIAKSRDINRLLYFTTFYFMVHCKRVGNDEDLEENCKRFSKMSVNRRHYAEIRFVSSCVADCNELCYALAISA